MSREVETVYSKLYGGYNDTTIYDCLLKIDGKLVPATIEKHYHDYFKTEDEMYTYSIYCNLTPNGAYFNEEEKKNIINSFLKDFNPDKKLVVTNGLDKAQMFDTDKDIEYTAGDYFYNGAYNNKESQIGFYWIDTEDLGYVDHLYYMEHAVVDDKIGILKNKTPNKDKYITLSCDDYNKFEKMLERTNTKYIEEEEEM